jgi:hypothetical protein
MERIEIISEKANHFSEMAGYCTAHLRNIFINKDEIPKKREPSSHEIQLPLFKIAVNLY